MNNLIDEKYQFQWTPNLDNIGFYEYIIYANDTVNNNWNKLVSSIVVEDSTPPNLFNYLKNENSIELGSPLNISINTTDFTVIK